MNDCVSVVMPVKNGAATLCSALSSVVKCLRTGDEVVVIDDHSIDSTVKIARSYQRVRVIPADGSGIVDALNTGLLAARGGYIARCDADDQWLLRNLSEEVAHLDLSGALASFGGARRVDLEGNVLRHEVPPTPTELGSVMLRRNALVHGAVLMRRTEIVDLGGYRDIPMAEDYDLWMRLLRAGHITTIPTEVYRYTESIGNSYSHKRRVQARSTLRILREHRSLTGDFHAGAFAKSLARSLAPTRRMP